MLSAREVLFLSLAAVKIKYLLLFASSILYYLAGAFPPYNLCSNSIKSNNTSYGTFKANLNNLLLSLPSNALTSNFYNTTIGNEPDVVYGLFLCYEYVSRDDCDSCITLASEDILRNCPDTVHAMVWEEVCQLRYSKEKFFSHLDVTGNVPLNNTRNVSDPERFRAVVNDTLHGLTQQAAFNYSAGMYATKVVPFTETSKIYALVQCTIDLSPDDCNSCLETAIGDILGCCYFSRGARLLSLSCYLRYEFYAFYEGATESSDAPSNQERTGIQKRKWIVLVLAIGPATLAIVLLGFCIYCLALRKQTQKSQGRISAQEFQLLDVRDRDFLNQEFQARGNLNPREFPLIHMETICAATDEFSNSNKLGEGGFGSVYKGILADGKEIAVKRLSSCSEQGSDEFINEVLLIFRLQHKNLVKLLGFCVHIEEKLLVYEYMPNSSLDAFLFDPKKRLQLKWGKRLHIINGIARGIMYLHHDSRLKIIHRDLKPSNVLLDRDMTPKISDFGMARIFGGSDGEVNTARIIGTYGYMAPEYAMEGVYSIKSDVFSFGVLVLEIITGRRNAGCQVSQQHTPSLLGQAWKLWNDGQGLKLMDTLLNESCPTDEFLRCMHIGLLCVQQNACDRPTMSSVVVMLNSATLSLSQPKRPAFFVGRCMEDIQEKCYEDLSVNSLTI